MQNHPQQERAIGGAEHNLKQAKTKQEEIFLRPELNKVEAFFKAYGEQNKETLVRMTTRLGDIDIRLYEDTPIHRANFIYNIKNQLYYRTIFYRVVPDFMIQGGNSDDDKTLLKREHAGAYYIPNETNTGHIHKYGSIAMAMSYEDNPESKSAQYSFYIVIGKKLDDKGLDAVEEEYDIIIPEAHRKIYRSIGGTPHLDGKHTVFGEVVNGMEVVEAITKEKRDDGDWPINDVVIDYYLLETP
jgi:cyclophilin family peptidyl-prolyl cis-trans isomerase